MSDRLNPDRPDALLPCRFCGKPPGTKVGPPALARCMTFGCEGKDLAAFTFVEWNTRSTTTRDGAEGADLYFEPSGDGMGACIHHANGAIICEAKYDDFGNDPSEPERIMKQLVSTSVAQQKDRALIEAFERNLPDLVEKYRDTIDQVAAPAKPAPDAMRNALESVSEEISDNALWALASTLHSNVPEEKRPMSWSDFLPEQIERLHQAANAFLAALAAPVPPADGPDYETAARALGFLRMEATGNWIHPKDDDTLMRRYSSAEEIFNQELPGLFAAPCASAAEPELREIVHDKMRGMLADAQPDHPILANPRGDRETAREIVTEWLGMFDPPPQIDFQQSEFLQNAIASALAIPRTALPVQPGAGERPRWKHKNRGTFYTEIGRGHLQSMDTGGLTDNEPVVIYQGDDGKLWVRDVVEFEDGRFEFVPPSRQAPHSSSGGGR